MPCWDTCSLRPQNNNWQDWKYTSFVIFIRYSQSIRRHNVICREKLVADVVENNGLKPQFLSWFSIHFVLHRSYRFSYQMDLMYQCVIMSCIDLYLIEEKHFNEIQIDTKHCIYLWRNEVFFLFKWLSIHKI